MALPSVRSKLLPVRGLKASLDAVVADLVEGEICYATDEDQYYQKEGGVLVQVGATKAQGALADTAVQRGGDNMTGNLTLGTDKITLDATGTAEFAGGDVIITGSGNVKAGDPDNSQGSVLSPVGQSYVRQDGGNANTAGYAVYNGGLNSTDIVAAINFDGSASFAGNLTSKGSFLCNANGSSVSNGTNEGITASPNGRLDTCRESGTQPLFQGFTKGNSTATSTIFADGSSTFLGNVGVGTDSPLRSLHIAGAGDTSLMLQTTNATDDKEIWEIQAAADASNNANLVFRQRTNTGTGGIEALRFDSSGRMLVGTSSNYGLSTTAVFSGLGGAEGIVSIINDDDTFVNTNDKLGTLNFGASESGGNAGVGATIEAVAEGAWAADTPGRIEFKTVQVGSNLLTERMRIGADGRVGIGGTSPDARLFVSDTSRNIQMRIGSTSDPLNPYIRLQGRNAANTTTSYSDIQLDAEQKLLILADPGDTSGAIGANPFCIDEDGNVTTGKSIVAGYNNVTKTYTGGDTNYLQSQAGTDGQSNVLVRARTIANTNYVWRAASSGTVTSQILASGNFESATNSYGSTSDAKLKTNIVDAGSQWEDLKAITVRKYNYTEESGLDTSTQIGVVAQEVELVSPGLVQDNPDVDQDDNDLGTVTKTVKYSVLYMKAVKALQEAMDRIESLEQRLADAGL